MSSRRLSSETAAVSSLCAGDVAALYRIYERCYDGSDPARFEADLKEKHWVILLRDPASLAVVGFSTQTIIDVEVDGTPVRALFSGDTVIDPRYWGTQELVRSWCRLAGEIKARRADLPLYWFLTSKGYRTYLYLPCFFRTFYPRYDRPTPAFARRLIHVLGTTRYPREFNAATGLVEHRGDHDRVKQALDATPRHLANPHVQFFVRRNPRYREGSELVCVAEISPANMRSIARRDVEAALARAASAAAEGEQR
ncbi:MAG TPA: hypothetical protein VNN77_14125 [candidate division Zixibacteria bacterium]|nr:hypothetical protein [candidate division Zixibacteria bacterium]